MFGVVGGIVGFVVVIRVALKFDGPDTYVRGLIPTIAIRTTAWASEDPRLVGLLC